MLKSALAYLVLILSISCSFGQTFGSFSFANLPQDYQLYPRNASNTASLSIRAKSNSASTLGLFVYRNDQLKQVLKPSAINSLYTFNVTIPAELANYDFAFYAYNGADSTLVVKRSKIVSGDVIAVSGQSNAKLGPMDKNVYQGDWLRTFGKNKVIVDLKTAYNTADTLWNMQKLNVALDPITADFLELGLGPFASELARVVIESEKIPVAVISNAQPTTSIDFHLNFNGDLKNPIGGDILYYKIKTANLQNDVKTIVFVQGEAEILDDVAKTWPEKFLLLKDKFKKYFPNVKKIAFPQLNIYGFRANNSAWLRNEQRKLGSLDDVITWASVGNSGFDGLHYYGISYLKDPNNLYLFENKGYLQMATEVGRIVLKDVYNKNYSIQVKSPNIQKAYFPDADTRNQVILEFESGQNMQISLDTTVVDPSGKSWTHELKNNFFYSKFNQNSMGPYIKNITATENKVIINFNVNYDSNIISYLPEFHQEYKKDPILYPFPGPFIKNQYGMRAFAFSDIIIDEKIVYSDEFKLYPNPSADWIELKWPSTVNGTLILYDVLGKVLFTRTVANTRIMNINLLDYQLNPGKYLLKFIDDKGNSYSKAIIKI